MNQEKIGRFIAESRKNKKMTQSELAEKLGVSDRTVGNWENGRNMPDLSLFKSLCEELDITLNELMSGEKVEETFYRKKSEENLLNAIDYSTSKIELTKRIFEYLAIGGGIGLSFSAMTIFPSDSSWGSIFAILGALISLIGIDRLFKRRPLVKRMALDLCYLTSFLGVLIFIDYKSVLSLKQIPRFCITKIYSDNALECTNPIYNVYWINGNTKNRYIIVDKEKKYNIDTVPKVPFNRDKSGIDNIVKYKNRYIGNNSNTGNLINSLPLSEYGFVFEIDSENLGLTVDYHITDWYIDENYYLEKSLLYNTLSIFALIDNVEYIHFNFSGKTYETRKSDVVNNYADYSQLMGEEFSKERFEKYIESRVNDEEFIDEYFAKIISKS